MKLTALAAIGAISVLVGCSAGDEGGDGTPADETPTTTATSAGAPTTTTASAEPTPDGPTIGDSQKTDVAEYVVEEWVDEVDTEYLSEGENLSAAMVKACIHRLPAGMQSTWFMWQFWSVQADDGSTFQESGSLSEGWPRPVFPNGEMDGMFVAGDCARGWIYFQTAPDVTFTQVRYDHPESGVALRWTIP